MIKDVEADWWDYVEAEEKDPDGDDSELPLYNFGAGPKKRHDDSDYVPKDKDQDCDDEGVEDP